MKKLLSFGVLLTALALGACSGGGNTITSPGSGGGGAPGPNDEVATLEMLVSSTQLGTAAGSPAVQITAQAKDQFNAVVAGATVQFTTSSGSIAAAQNVTDSLGIALAELTNGGDPTNREITVTARVTTTDGAVTGTVVVNATGTQLRFLSGPDSLAQGDSATYTIKLEDSAGNGLQGEAIDIASSLGNSLSAASLTTDSAGAVQFTYTADNAGNDSLSATALSGNVEVARNIAISNDSFAITIEGGLTEIPLNTPTDVTVTWISAGVPVSGNVNLATTRGVLTPGSGATDGAGQLTVSIESATAGPALINATGQGGPTTSRSVEFVATTPANLDLQANPLTVATGDQATLNATVTDAAGNPVKNQTVNFAILLDPTGGSLGAPTAVTDSQGRASAVYNAGSTPSAQSGVQIQATIQGTAITTVENLTVARKELFISLGTGNDINEPNQAQFRKEWVVQVTDADGNAVSGVNVQVSINSVQWFQGCYVPGADSWIRVVTASCNDEDVNRNGVLDTVPATEDFNSNGRIEAGNIALVAAQGAGAGQAANVVTDNTGSALVDVLYPQSYHGWVRVEIEAKASVAGTETRRTISFVLDAKAEDINNLNASPPAQQSPFGRQVDPGPFCTTAPEDPQPDCPALP